MKDVKFGQNILDCEVCILSKMQKLPFKETRTRAERPLEKINCDTMPMGPIKPASFPGRNRFIVVFIDDYSRFAKAYCMKKKDDSGKALEKFLASARN